MSVDDRRAGPYRTVARGMVRRCGRCGGGGLFEGYFRLRERCPTCGYRFAREEGFFTGVYLVNFGVTEGLLWLGLMVYVVWRGVAGDASPLWPVLSTGLLLAVVTPIVYYPFAATTWAALDLAMRELEPEEEADAATWLASRD